MHVSMLTCFPCLCAQGVNRILEKLNEEPDLARYQVSPTRLTHLRAPPAGLLVSHFTSPGDN